MKLFLLLVSIGLCWQSRAQSAEDSVKSVIEQLFYAMKKSDGLLLKDCFADSAILQTITRSGTVRTDKAGEFVKQVSTMPVDSADERIVFETVKVDDGLALVWTPYQFYYAGKFSHCGVNSFTLVRMAGKWKIQYLIDTRRRINCN